MKYSEKVRLLLEQIPLENEAIVDATNFNHRLHAL